MTTEEFNSKYKDYLEERHYGLAVGDEDFISWLDTKFQEFIKQPGFTYSQIKSKFGKGTFYCEGLSNEQINEVENKITELCKNKQKIWKKERGVKITDRLEFDITTGSYDGNWDENTVSIYKYFDIIE